MRFKVNAQGKAVVERCGECPACQEWMLDAASAPMCECLLVMLPSGNVVHVATRKQALERIKQWFADSMDAGAYNVGTIEWRHGTSPTGVVSKSSR